MIQSAKKYKDIKKTGFYSVEVGFLCVHTDYLDKGMTESDVILRY